MSTGDRSGAVSDLVKGAVAGAAGVWVMDRVDWFMVEHENPEVWRRTQAVRPNGRDPAHNMAGLAARALGASPPPQPHPAGVATHYAVGVAPAMAYAATRRHLPGGILGRGLLFGLGMFLVEDEILNPLIGAAAPPRRYPWQAHARGLVAHLVFGVVTEAALAALERPRRPSASARPRARRGRVPRRTSQPGPEPFEADAYGVRFALQHEGRRVRVVVTHEALHKAEGALTGGPIDQDELAAFVRHRPLLQQIAMRKWAQAQIEEDGTVRITTVDLNALGA